MSPQGSALPPEEISCPEFHTPCLEFHTDESLTEISSVTASMSDADAAAGMHSQWITISSPPSTCSSGSSTISSQDDEPTTEPVFLLGMDISGLSRRNQFFVCASGLFCFSLMYGYLQELISVQLCNRQLGLFLACIQFSGYSLWSFTLRNYVGGKRARLPNEGTPAPITVYIGLSLLRAIEIGMTNLAIQYINYPAKTLMKSTRVMFTMAFGLLIARKKYKVSDYIVVFLMVSGLIVFMHADASSSAVFHHWGIIMLTISMLCDGAISNISEAIMSRYGVGQDDFIFNMYSIALIAVAYAAAFKGDLLNGFQFLLEPGTYSEMNLPLDERSTQWTPSVKLTIVVLFSSMGFFGASCSAAITKNFGALSMAMTSTARKATTLFLSFFLFDNACTVEHVGGIVLFMSSLIYKGFNKKKKQQVNANMDTTSSSHRRMLSSQQSLGADSLNDLEMAIRDNTNKMLSVSHVV